MEAFGARDVCTEDGMGMDRRVLETREVHVGPCRRASRVSLYFFSTCKPVLAPSLTDCDLGHHR